MSTTAKTSRAAKPKPPTRSSGSRKRGPKKTVSKRVAELAEDLAAREKIAATLDVEAFMKDYEKNKEASMRYWESKE